MYEFLEETVAANMTLPARYVAPETTVGDLHRLFAADEVESYPVVQNGAVIGIVSKFDALKPFVFNADRILPHYDDLMGTTVDEIMSRDVVSTDAEAPLPRVLGIMVTRRLKSLPVLDRNRHLVGIIAHEDVFRALKRCTHRQKPHNVRMSPARASSVCRHIA